MKKAYLLLLFCLLVTVAPAQSVARKWNEEVLNAIRNDFARPTVHARNLFHTSIAMYDSWAVFSDEARTFFLGNRVGGYNCEFSGFTPNEPVYQARHKAMSYAVYRLIKHRFVNAPKQEEIYESVDMLMNSLGYNPSFTGTDYSNGNAAALGNYLAQQLINFGLQDGSNEVNDYENRYYEPLNEALNTDVTGNPNMLFPNHWQPLRVENYVDQSGNIIPGGQPPFLSPEWGQVVPFALNADVRNTYSRDGFDYKVYYDPGSPPFIQQGLGIDDPYKEGFAMVSVWGAHLDKDFPKRIDISPASLGNVSTGLYPGAFDRYSEFYNFFDGGDPGVGRDMNPSTGQPYEKQMVKLGDYARVLAEFWADGPDSETPPGHWFTILNYVNDHPELKRRFRGKGQELDALEWDVKAYFVLGGTMHDAAISAWGIKGYYDYVRPISAIRYMGDRGQSSDPNEIRYDLHGLPLIPGYIEIVKEGDPLAGDLNENVGKMKVYSWRGPDYIVDPNEDIAGVGWILSEEWFPYQRPSFVTPPFAGYVSGHSTYSRAAAEVLTLLTGDEYFPGGMGVFDIPKDTFLKFEKGPSEAFQLQWATYRDASDQTSLSRIWGGIHPPCDDLPGRLIGEKVGLNAFAFAEQYFFSSSISEGAIFPNPVRERFTLQYKAAEPLRVCIYDSSGRRIYDEPADFDRYNRCLVNASALSRGLYLVSLETDDQRRFTTRMVKD